MKNLINTTLALLFAANLSAQNPDGWIEEGAEWFYGTNVFGASSYIEAKYTGVETIDGIDFQKISSVQQWLYPQSGGGTSLGEVQNLSDRFYHTSNDSVYLRKEDGTLQFVWHLNPQVGDVWDFGLQTDLQGENAMHAYALVTQVQTIEIAGVQTKNIKTTPCLDTQGTLPTSGDVYYSSNFLQDFNLLFGPTQFNYTGVFLYSAETTAIDLLPTNLQCYHSESTPFYQVNNSTNCYNNVILSNGKLAIPEFTLFPNPATTTFSLTNPEQIQSVQIYDIQGRLQLRGESLPLDVRSMTSGVYWVQIETLDGQVNMEKLVVE